MARPKKKIDRDMVRKLAEKQWNIAEISTFFGAHRRTIERRFAAVIDDGKNSGKAKLKDIRWAAIQTLAQYMDPSKPVETKHRIAAASKLINIIKEESIKVEIPVGEGARGTYEYIMGVVADLEREKAEELGGA